MPNRHHPRRGSMGFSPRKRAKAETPHIKSWPEGFDKPKIQGFLGYKAGMTHAHIVDYRPTSTTSGREVVMPVSVVVFYSMLYFFQKELLVCQYLF